MPLLQRPAIGVSTTTRPFRSTFTRRRMIGAVAAACALPAGASPAGFPARPLRLVVPFPPGGAVDAVARLVAQQLQARGLAAVVDNRAGGNGIVATEHVAHAAADGHTVLFTTDAPIVALPQMGQALGYAPLTDLAPVAQLATLPLVLVASATLGVRDLQEFVQRVRSAPGRHDYATNGAGGGPHLAMEQLKTMAGLDIRHVPYKGSVQASQDLVAGRVAAMFSAITGVSGLIESGKLRALGVSSATATPLLPQVPAIAQQGYPEFRREGWMGVFLPAATPVPLREAWEQWLQAMSVVPAFADQVDRTGNPSQFAAASAFRQRVADDYRSAGALLARIDTRS